MKRLLLLIPLLLLAACESERTIPTKRVPSGESVSCVGVLSETRQSGVEYAPSIRNIAVGAFFIETIITPAVVVAVELKCPVLDTTVTR